LEENLGRCLFPDWRYLGQTSKCRFQKRIRYVHYRSITMGADQTEIAGGKGAGVRVGVWRCTVLVVVAVVVVREEGEGTEIVYPVPKNAGGRLAGELNKAARSEKKNEKPKRGGAKKRR